ncbi:IS6 family transposase, partial [Providencia rettgeri]
MTDFKWRHFQGDVILWAVRWYCRYPISYRDLEEMLAERGISVDHTTIYRWVQCYAPEMEKRLRWFWRRGFDPSWRLDETYVKVRGKWTYLYRAVDKRGDTIDFYLSPTRSAKAAKRFLGKALRGLKHWEKPATLNTDKALMNPLMILVKIIKLRWIHILSYDQMVSRKINNQTTRCANSIFYTTLFTN